MKKILLILVALLIACFFALVSCEKESVPYVVGAGYDTDNNLILEYSDGSTLNLGKINQKGEQGEKGEQGIQGEKGDKGEQGIQGDKGDQGVQGEKGVGISKAELVNGELIITYTDGTTDNLGKIVSQEKSEGTDGLEYYSLPDGTYAVSAGTTKYLEEIVIPSTHNGKGVSKILDGAFEYCTSLTSVTIPDSVTSIGYNAFFCCTALKSVTIPDSVTSIGADAFSGCTSIKEATIPVSAIAHIPTSSLQTLVVSGEGAIGPFAFENCTSLKSVTIKGGVASIGSGAFLGCTSLEDVVIGDGVTTVESQAFEGCTSLKGIVIPDGVTTMGYNVFFGCTKPTVINCEVASEPSGWSSAWKSGCSATINWGYTGE